MNKNKSQSKCWQQRINLLTYLTKLPKNYSLNFSMVKISCNQKTKCSNLKPINAIIYLCKSEKRSRSNHN